MRNTLDTLQSRTLADLKQIYGEGKVADPRRMDGDFRGAVVGMETKGLVPKLFSPVRLLSSIGLLPWQGKSFSHSGQNVIGINRILKFGLKLFQFVPTAGTSLLDHRPTLVLDYDQKGNPYPIRLVRDELRQIDDSLYLGPMFYKTSDPPPLVLYFALSK